MPETTELGHAVGAIRALDGDIGENAEMDYRIIGSDGPGVFDVATNRSTQEGVIVLRKVSGWGRVHWGETLTGLSWLANSGPSCNHGKNKFKFVQVHRFLE